MTASIQSDSQSWLLRAIGLSKTYAARGGDGPGIRAVDQVDLEIRPGTTLSLVGESGCGKTTVGRCVLRAIDPSGGEVLYRSVDGQVLDLATADQATLRRLRGEIQMVFQDPYASLNPRLTVREIIAEPLKIFRYGTRAQIDERVRELLELVGLRRDHARRFPNAFSGGQRQRIGIARALALNPRFLVTDEAVSALDVSVQAQILNLLLDLQDRLGLSYLFISHDLGVVKHVSDEVAVMYVGQIVELAPCEALFERPLHPYTAALLQAIPRMSAGSTGGTRALQGEPPSARNLPVGCYFQNRCPHSIPACSEQSIPLIEIEPGRKVRCIRAGELELLGVTNHG
jgi:oligopeptide/dipeptide ABC transporter ATP-binding protein